MLDAIKSLLANARQARRSGEVAEAERLYKQAAEDARAQDAVGRAEALCGAAQMRRDRGDRSGASIYYAEAITLLRTEHSVQPETIAPTLAYALRHSADVRSELSEFAVAGSHVQEAVRLYRAIQPQPTLDLANALRVEALNNERESIASWTEAHALYEAFALTRVPPQEPATDAGVQEAQQHLDRLKQIAPASNDVTKEPAHHG